MAETKFDNDVKPGLDDLRGKLGLFGCLAGHRGHLRREEREKVVKKYARLSVVRTKLSRSGLQA